MNPPVPRKGSYDVRVGDLKRGFGGRLLGPDLYDCLYGARAAKMMIKRAPHPGLPSKFEYLCDLENPSMLAVMDFFIDGDQKGCVVMESADEKFEDWIRRTKKEELFIPSSRVKSRLSTLLRNMFLELANLIDTLIKENCCPAGLDITDLYIKNKIQGGRPTLKAVIVYKVLPIGSSKTMVPMAWKAVSDIMVRCCQLHQVDLDATSIGFKNYFGIHRSAQDLECYPDSWSEDDKKNYIYMIIRGNRNVMSNAIIAAKVGWPMDPHDRSKAVHIVEQIYHHHNNASHNTAQPVAPYDKKVPWCYFRLCRNTLKSFDIPKGLVKNDIEFLKKMEQWEPKLWMALYKEIGPLEGGELDC